MPAAVTAQTLAPLAISTLAQLNEKPMHPYEMYHLLLSRHEDKLLKISVGSLYRTIQRLEELGYARVVGTEAKGNRPERTTYEITEAGYAALVNSVRAQLRGAENHREPWLLALAEAHNAPPDDIVADLKEHLSVLRAELDELDAILADAQERGALEIWLVTGHYLRHMTQAKYDWLTTFVNRVESNQIPWQ